VVTEPASTATMEMILHELRGRFGLVILSAWSPSIEAAASNWGAGLAIGGVGTDHTKVGEIQGRQGRFLLGERGRILYVAGPLRASAALAAGERSRLIAPLAFACSCARG
jgi:hypothetical protein